MADNSFLSKLLEAISPDANQFPENLEKDATELSRGSGIDLEAARQELIKDHQAKQNQPLPSDGDLVRNVLMKGVLPPSTTPNFSAGDKPMWWSPQGPVKPEQIPPSPLKPEIQEQMLKAAAQENLGIKPEMPMPPPAMPVAAKPMAPRMPAAQPKELPQPKAQVPAAPQVPKEDERSQLLKKLIESATDDKELRQAMEDQRRDEAMAMMMRGVVGIGTGLSGQGVAGPGADYLKDYIESARNRTQQVKELMKGKQEKIKFAMETEKGMLDLDKTRMQMDDTKAMQDPNSDISKAWREAARTRFKLAGVKIPANLISDALPASKVKELFPSGDIVDDLIKLKGIEESAALRKEAKTERNQQQAQQQVDRYVQHTQDKFKDDVNKVKEGRTALGALESAMRNPSSVKDLQAIYNMIKAFDPNSAVREGELVMAQKGQSFVDNAKTLFSKIGNNPRLLTGRYLKDVYEYAQAAQNAREQNYRGTMDARLDYAKKRLGLPEGQEIFIDPLYEETKGKKSTAPNSPFDSNKAMEELKRRKKQ